MLKIQRGAPRQMAQRQLEGRVVPQAGGIAAVRIAGGNQQHQEPQDGGDAVHDTPRRAGIGHAGGQLCRGGF